MNLTPPKTAMLVLAALIFSLAFTFTTPATAGEKVKVFLLAGQSNMVGHANPHTIATLYQSGDERDTRLAKMVFKADSGLSKDVLQAQLEAARKLDELGGGISMEKVKKMEDGPEKTELEAKVKKRKEAHEAYKAKVREACVESERVYIHSIADGSKKSGKLGVGYGGGGKKLGPEYSFGISIAEKVEGPILLIKTSWGGKSINYHFRPPSAGAYELNDKEKAKDNADEIKERAGINYRMMNESIREVLDNIEEHHPAYDSNAGYEIAGFVWFQGYNDQFSDAFRDNYEACMVHFIKDIRETYKVPKLPFVIGVLGTGVTEEKVGENKVSLAQRAAAKTPEFEGNVVSVESYKDYALFSQEIFKKGWPKHYHEWDSVGSDRPYHYLGSGTFFVRLGDSFATAMAGMMPNPDKK